MRGQATRRESKKRKLAAWVILAALGGLGGCASIYPETGGFMPQSGMPHIGKGSGPANVPGLVGPYGQPVAMAAPYDMMPPASRFQAQQMMARSMPLDMVQMNGCPGPNCGMVPTGLTPPGGGMPPTVLPRGGILSPPGMPFAPGVSAGSAVTPSSYMQNSNG